MYTRRDHLDYLALGLMLLLCFLWGFQQITIKYASVGVSPVLQAGIRSIIATVLLSLWMFSRKIRPFQKDGTWLPGILAGLLFSTEFVFIYWGLQYTSASRAVIFIYISPFVVALGMQYLIPSEKLNGFQVAGMFLAFIGILVAFGEGFTVLNGNEWIGDLMCLAAAIFWGATTILVRVSKLSNIDVSRTLYYHLLVSAILLPPLSFLMGESGITQLTPLIIGSLAFQGVLVAFASYLVWYWLIAHYPAARLATYTFFTPLFGVICGVIFLNEPFTFGLLIALVLVTTGIYLVNKRPVSTDNNV